MKKEKKVRTYQRRTKTGKLVTVKQHTAKYDAAEKAKEMLKKKGAGDELSAKKKAKPVSSAGELDFSQADFKAWYHWDQENDPKNPTALKVEKALKAKMGAKAYRKFFNDMSDSYSARGHLKAYKECQSCGDKGEVKTAKTTRAKSTEVEKPKTKPNSDTKMSKDDLAKLKKAVKAQSDYVKHLNRLKTDSEKEWIANETQILNDLKKHKGSVKPDSELSAIEKSYARKNKLRYEEDGIYSDKSGKVYRISVHPITGAAKTVPLTGSTMGATTAQLRAAGMKKGDYDAVDYDKLSSIIWGSKEKKSPKSSPKSSEKTTKATPKSSKELREELKAAERREYNATVKKHRDTTKAALDKAGVSKEDVIAYMKGMQGGRRKWTWHGSEGVFKTNRMADGSPMKGYDTKTMAQAIKQMQKAQGKTDSPKSEKSTKVSSKDLQSKIDTLKEKAGYRKKGVSFHVIGSSGKYSVMLNGGRTMDKTFKTKREAQEALVGELTKMTKEPEPKVGPRRVRK